MIGSLQNLHPGYFALVMATGIVSIAAHALQYPRIAWAMFALNCAAYLILWMLYVARAVWFPRAVLADLSSHARGVGFFTTIAATCVLGSQFTIIGRSPHIAFWLWVLGIVLWMVLIYGILTLLTIQAEKPSLVKGLNGGWLVAVVAAQSVSVLGSQLAPQVTEEAREPVLFFALVMWLGGGMLYIWLISMIFYRYTFFAMSPMDLAPPYWINMGSVAISTLAGTFLIASSPESPMLAAILPFTKGMTLFFWATATWWIPMLLTLGVWRHVYERIPIHYDPLYWGAVFPLGMYTMCTYRLADTVDAPFLHIIPRYFFFIALAAWIATAFGLARALLSYPKDQASSQ